MVDGSGNDSSDLWQVSTTAGHWYTGTVVQWHSALGQWYSYLQQQQPTGQQAARKATDTADLGQDGAAAVLSNSNNRVPLNVLSKIFILRTDYRHGHWFHCAQTEC